MMGPRRALLDLPNWLGDVLHALPAVQRLATATAGWQLLVAVPEAFLPLARLVGVAAVARPPAAGWRWARRALAGDLALALTARHSTRAKLLLAGTSARRKLASRGRGAALVGLETFAVDRSLHQRHDLDAALAALGLAGVDERPYRLQLPAALRHQGERWRARVRKGGPLAVLLPGSSHQPDKRYPTVAYAEVARRLLAQGVTPAMLGGPGDEAVVSVLAQVEGVRLAPVAVPVDFAAAVLAVCDVAIGNDSGLTHLAAVVGCPTVALYGPTDPARTAPVGGATILATKGFHGAASWASLPPAEVAAVACAVLERPPGGGLAARGRRQYDADGGGPLAQLAEQGTLNP